jgi:hypothetical protein
MKVETIGSKETRQVASPLLELGFRIREQGKIVHVPEVRGAAEMLFDEVVERSEIEIRKELARQIAYREPFAAREGRQKVIPAKVVTDMLLLVAGVDDSVDEPQSTGVGNPPADHCLEDRMIDRGKILSDIALEDIGVTAQEPLKASDGAVCSLTDTVSIGVVDEAARQERA